MPAQTNVQSPLTYRPYFTVGTKGYYYLVRFASTLPGDHSLEKYCDPATGKVVRFACKCSADRLRLRFNAALRRASTTAPLEVIAC